MDKQYLPGSGSIKITVQKNKMLELHEPKKGEKLSVSLVLEEKARVVYVTGSLKEIQLEVTLGQQAQFNQTFSSTFQEQRKQVFILEGKQALVQVNGSYVLTKNKSNFEVVQLHKASQTSSSVELKTVLDGTADFEYRGIIKIEQSASGSSAHQENKNLIVSKQARALSIPSLEALNDDVQCGHGSAVSYINQEHLFYLASRGIMHNAAKKMIIQGFIQ